jgi:hypothetical protein
MGLIFGLSAITTSVVQEFLQKKSATQFAQQYVGVLKTGKLEDAFFYTVAPPGREGKNPAELYKSAQSQARDPRMLEMGGGSVLGIKRKLDEKPGGDVHFVRLENYGVDGLNIYATALLELHSPAGKDASEKEEFAMVLLKGMPKDGKYQWWIEEAKYPYQPGSHVVQPKAPDDGHGHTH